MNPTNEESRELNDYLFDLNGYRIIQNAVTPEQIAQINGWIDQHPVDKTQVGQWIGHVEVQTYMNEDGVNYQNIVEGGKVYEELLTNPAWYPDIKRYIGNFGSLSLNECLINVRGSGGFIGMHSGGHMPWMTGLFRHPQTAEWFVGQINVIVALNDIGPGDGATTLVPGSHKSVAPHPHFKRQKAGENTVTNYDTPADRAEGMIECHLKAGDALLFTDGVTHGSCARINPGFRRILLYRYCPAWCITRFNYIASDRLLSSLNEEQRRLVQPVKPRLAPGQELKS
ncbi:phytanoyl-CoA dioxygenase family protein [Oscillatoria laete-virens NRMC-F 0139]|nr:phytanoyl-CoA dioxygenase family protein [Oscillatoria laete-virens]MDL5055743.1 phytanoyl-CoA dioxygenase family protein [Oscillatoria laete-virens NRMC-F 0139]